MEQIGAARRGRERVLEKRERVEAVALSPYLLTYRPWGSRAP